MPAIPLAGPIIGGIGSIVGGVMGASAAKKAADAQAKAAQAAAANSVASANNATDYGNQVFNYQRNIQSPFLNLGTSAAAELGKRMGLNVPQGVAGPAVNAGMLSLPGGAPNAPKPPQAVSPQAGTPGFKTGGIVYGPGTGTSDSVPTKLSTGEGVVNSPAMKMPGVADMIMRLNKMASGKNPKIGGTHFAMGGMVADPNTNPTMGQPANLGGMTAAGNPATSSVPSAGATGAGPFSGVNAAGISDPTVRTIVGAAQGGVNMNSLPGGQTANNEQPGLMNSLNIGYNGQIPGAPGYAGSSPAAIDPTAPTATGLGTQAMKGFTANMNPGEAMAPPTGPTGLMTANPANVASGAGPSGAMTPAGGDGAAAQPFQTGDGSDGGNLLQGFDQQFQSPTNVTEQNDPGYAFRLQQGQQALERSAAARGGLLTGGTAKDLANYQQGLASQEYGNVYDRALNNYKTNQNTFYTNQNNLYNRLMGVTGVGQNAANTLTGAGSNSANNISGIDMNSANQVGQDLTNAGTARASGYVGANNALSGILPGIGSSVSLAQILRQNGNPSAPAGVPSGGWGAF